MKAKTNGKRTSVSIATAILLLLSALVFLLPTVAYADGNDSSEAEHVHECDIYSGQCYENIYYFSDCVESELYMNMYIRNYANMYSQLHDIYDSLHWYDLSSEDAAPRFGSAMSEFTEVEGGYSQVVNSLVIYEMRELFPIQLSGSRTNVITAPLKDIFYTLRENNCKIMFICGTDERMFDGDDNNEFLDYVDIHINTDVYSYFAQTACNIMQQCGMSGSTLILDRDLSEYVMNGSGNAETMYEDFLIDTISGNFTDRYNFLTAMLVPYLRYVNGYSSTDPDYQWNIYVLGKVDLRVLCHLGGNDFYDILYNRYVTNDVPYEDFFDEHDQNIFFIGTTRKDNGFELGNWLYDVKQAFNMDNDRFKQFMFREYGAFDAGNYDPDIYTAGKDRFAMADYLKPMIEDFIFGRDLSVYDNWTGRCDITAKPFVDGDGWLEMLSNEDLNITLDETSIQYYYWSVFL